MPFTLAHAAIVIPIKKYFPKFSYTALVAGSMVPDFEFFLQMREVNNIGHHWTGILLFDLPMGIIMCYVYHNLLKKYVVLSMPKIYKRKLVPTLYFNWNQYASKNFWWMILSLITGIASHIFLDAFTHANSPLVEATFLSQYIYFEGYSFHLYAVLQILLSILGIYILYTSIIKIPRNRTYKYVSKKPRYYWFLFIMITMAIFITRLYGLPAFNSFWGIFMAIMGSIIYGWLSVSAFYKFFVSI